MKRFAVSFLLAFCLPPLIIASIILATLAKLALGMSNVLKGLARKQ